MTLKFCHFNVRISFIRKTLESENADEHRCCKRLVCRRHLGL